MALALSVAPGLADAGQGPIENVDPDSEGLKYAWSENGGWLNADPGVVGLFVPASGSVTGWIWSENYGWISTNCSNTVDCQVPFEVKAVADEMAPEFVKLVGYGWGENIGWISFSCENTNSCLTADFGVRIDRVSGVAFGYAWSENAGWISFGCLSENSCAQQTFGIKFDIAVLGSSIFSDGFEGNPNP